MNKVTQVWVGVDVSKASLDVCVLPMKQSFRVANTSEGIAQLLKKLAPFNVVQVACENTGRYEALMLNKLMEAHYTVWAVQPNRIKSFIRSEGKRAKNDKIDAYMIALFAMQKKNPHQHLQYLYSQQNRDLQTLVARRRALVRMISDEKRRAKSPQPNDWCESIKQHIDFMNKQLVEIDKAIADSVKNDPVLQKKEEIIESIPGVGKKTVAMLLSFVPELGLIKNKQAAALLGVAPNTFESGQYVGKAAIGGGRKEPRNVLYMAALCAIVHNSTLKAFYERLIQKGKAPKVAIVAVMRKLVTILNAMLRKGELWRPAN